MRRKQLNSSTSSGRVFESVINGTIYVITPIGGDTEILGIAFDEPTAFSISNSYGTDFDGNQLTEIHQYGSVDDVLRSYGKENLPTEAVACLFVKKTWIRPSRKGY